VDVGANEPEKGSQTWFLEQQGWRGVLVEPQARFAEKLRQARPRSVVFQVACGAPGHPEQMTLYIAESATHSSLGKNLVEASTKYLDTEMVRVMTLDAVLAEAGNPAIDFISIDVEGTQLDVLRGFSMQRHRPKLLFIEDHLHNLKVHRYLKQQGYKLVKRTGSNNWYVPEGTPFDLSTPLERLALWKKIWANTPFRKVRVYLEQRRAAKKAREANSIS
jgi:FkbM family methyltransferase